MKKIFLLMLAAVALTMVSCQKTEVAKVNPNQLVGRWTAPSQADGAESGDVMGFVFQSGDCGTDAPVSGLKWGYQWDEGDDVQESDVSSVANHDDPGWFGWTINSDSTKILLYSRSGIGGAWKGYFTSNYVSAFSATSMTMMDGGNTYVFTKKNK